MRLLLAFLISGMAIGAFPLYASPPSAAQEAYNQVVHRLFVSPPPAGADREWSAIRAELEIAYQTLHYAPAAFLLGTLWEQSTDPAGRVRMRDWYHQAATDGHTEAAIRLALAYHHGWGGVADQEKALDWLDRAAQTGDPEALYYRGLAAREGWTGEPQPKEAATYFARIKTQHMGARYNLGLLYATGAGGERDWVAACTELDIVSHSVHPLAESAKQLRHLLFSQMSRTDIETALRRAHQKPLGDRGDRLPPLPAPGDARDDG